MNETIKTATTMKPSAEKPEQSIGKSGPKTKTTEGSAGKNVAFRLDPKANITGTHLVGYIEAQPFVLVAVFGKPHESDGYKVSGEYVFSNDRGEVFTLYDWKSTSLYFGPGAPTPEEFWESDVVHELNIGGKTDAKEFIEWFVETVNSYFERKQRLVDRVESVLREKGLDPNILYR